jgi:xanthine/CO dehydrogenase XdhC/CoxF family maturation factor
MAELYDALKQAIADERPAVLVTLIAGPVGVGDKLLVYDDGGPIGLSLGARTPPEIAVSIVAQIVQVKNG